MTSGTDVVLAVLHSGHCGIVDENIVESRETYDNSRDVHAIDLRETVWHVVPGAAGDILKLQTKTPILI